MKISNWLMLLIIVLSTIITFFLFEPVVKTRVFCLNMVLSVILEIIAFFMRYWNFKHGQKLTSTLQVVFYIFMCGIWMLAFNFFLVNSISIHWCYAGFILLTINYFAVLVFIYQSKNHQNHVHKRWDCEKYADHDGRYRHLLHKFEDVINNVEKGEDCRMLNVAVEKICIIPWDTRRRNVLFMEKIDSEFEKIEKQINTLFVTSNPEEKVALLEQIKKDSRNLLECIVGFENNFL